MDGKKLLASSLLGDSGFDPRQDTARTLSPTPSARFSLRRVSHSSAASSSAASTTCGSTYSSKDGNLSPGNSCVSRDTSDGDCGTYRFIAWAAVKRNACQGMTPSERLECPLLRCRRRCDSHEEMLRHLAGCEQLETCEYWCYSHMRVERFDDKKCQRCLTQKSKRRRMLCKAKNFFSSLGQKGKKSGMPVASSDFGGGDDDESLMFPVPFPSYSLLDIDPACGYELSGNAIVEIDSTEISHPLPPSPSTPAVVNPQVLVLPEVDTRMLVADDPSIQWKPDAAFAPEPIFVGQEPTSEGRPLLQLNTFGMEQYLHAIRFRPKPRPNAAPVGRSKDLSPSSSVRSTNSTTSTASDVSHTSSTSATSNVSSLVSPASVFSHASFADTGFAKHLTSPDDMLMGPDEALLTPVDQHIPPSLFDSMCPPAELLHSIFTELPADFPHQSVATTRLSADQALFDLNQATYSGGTAYASELFTKDVNFVTTSEAATSSTKCSTAGATQRGAKMPQSAAEALVASTWDTLLEHVASSRSKAQNVANNPLADKLCSLTSTAIAREGLTAIRGLLDGCPPTHPIKILCLVHVVYALSLVVYGDDELCYRSRQLYIESVVYARLVGDIQLESLMTAIWQPTGVSQTEISQGLCRKYRSLQTTPSQKGKECLVDLGCHVAYDQDPLLCTALDFLDELECSAILKSSTKPSEILTMGVYAKQLGHDFQGSPSTSLVTAARTAIGQLAKRFTSRGELLLGLQEIHGRLSSGSISSVRRLEIELLLVGKTCLPTKTFFAKYKTAAGQVCDWIYQQYAGRSAHRSVYQDLDLNLLEITIAKIDRGGQDDIKHGLVTPPLVDDTDGDALFDAFINTMTPSLMEAMSAEDMVLQLEPEKAVLDSTNLGVGQDHGTPGGAGQAASITGATDFSSGSTSPSSFSSAFATTTIDSKSEANSCCELCGYRPKGDPQWFKGSMAKHRKLQHSAQPPTIYKCPYPGCNSAYKNRPDNLRQHQIEKGHFVEGEEPPRRPSKRKKISE